MTFARTQFNIPRSAVYSSPRLMQITQEMLPFLDKFLLHFKSEDPFARSAAYYAMTGRNGLYLYRNYHTAMLVAIHPNKNDTLLLFTPFGADKEGLMESALLDPQIRSLAPNIEWARIADSEGALVTSLSTKINPLVEIVQEETLDWRQPVHVVSAQPIEELNTCQSDFRRHANRGEREGYKASPLDINQHGQDVLTIVDFWAQQGKWPGYETKDLTGPTKSLIDLMQSTDLPIRGLIVYDVTDVPIGFWIWDETDRMNKTAMSLARVSIGHLFQQGQKRPGASEYAAWQMAKMLRQRGIEQMCLGGSETVSLDCFKRKLTVRSGPMATRSISLRTAIALRAA